MAVFIPKNPARDGDTYRIANIFINYLLSEEPAVADAEMICYASPNSLVINNAEYIEYMSEIHEDAMDILYPEDLDFKAEYDKYCYRLLDPETNRYMNNLWSKLKIESGEGEDFDPTNIIALSMLAVIIAAAVFFAVRRKRREKYYS